jgi:hypothetical protein
LKPKLTQGPPVVSWPPPVTRHVFDTAWVHPEAGSQLSAVHEIASSQLMGFPAWQIPPLHVSPLVHALESLH